MNAEPLRKILALEREKDYDDSAVFGGLNKFLNNWSEQAVESVSNPKTLKSFRKLFQTDYASMTVEQRKEWATSVLDFLDKLEGKSSVSEKPETKKVRPESVKLPAKPKKAPAAKRAAAKAKKSEQQPEAAATPPKTAAPAKRKAAAAKTKAKAPKGKPAATRTRKKASTKKPLWPKGKN